jgi:hypothetical protein
MRGKARTADTIQAPLAQYLLVNELAEKKGGPAQRSSREFADVSNFQRYFALTNQERDMGALIPNGNDAEVINELNTAFSGSQLAKMRRHINNKHDDMFGNGRHLHRISYRLKVWPTSGNRAKGRWFIFLRDLVGAATRQKILKGIRDAVNDTSCAGIRFWARLDQGAPSDYDVDIVSEPADATGQHWVTITLLCDHEIDPTLPGDPSTPPPDNGEVSPPQPLVAKTTRGAPKKKSSKKSKKKSGKKAGKKKSAKR